MESNDIYEGYDKPSKPDDFLEGCFRTCQQFADIDVPIEIKPKAIVGKIKVECCGNPVIKHKGKCDSCDIVISQKISVKIPIKYVVAVKVDEARVDCGDAKCCD